jgi:hypothetical protein
MKPFSLISLKEKLQLVLNRFPVTLSLIAGLSVLLFVEINGSSEISYQWWIFLAIGAVISLAATLGMENTAVRWRQYVITLTLIALWGVYCFFLPPENKFHLDDSLQIGVIGAAFLCAAFFISFLKKEKDAAFWLFSQETIFQGCSAFLFSGILFAGLSLAVYSLDNLFNVNVSNKVYLNLLVSCFILFLFVYFLANIPGKKAKYNEEILFPKILKILGLYILSPILGIYTLILYAYLARIIVAWELPDGWVSILVSTLSIGGLLVILILYPLYLKKENKAAVLLSRYFGLLLLPLLVLMTIGIFRRISDYGITINRCYILLLNVWLYGIFIYLSITQSRHIKWILISPAIIFLLASAGPWRFSRITQTALQNRLETHFSQWDFLKQGKISLSDSPAFFQKMNEEDKKKIKETIEYLIDTYGTEAIQPFFEEDITDRTAYAIIRELNLSPSGILHEHSFSIDITGVYLQNIADYESFMHVCARCRQQETINISVENNVLHFENKMDGHSFSIPLKEQIINLLKERNNNYITLPFSPENKNFTIRGESYLLLITQASGELYLEKKDRIKINSFQGYLFYK